eukprot:Pgem_evm1s13464
MYIATCMGGCMGIGITDITGMSMGYFGYGYGYCFGIVHKRVWNCMYIATCMGSCMGIDMGV